MKRRHLHRSQDLFSYIMTHPVKRIDNDLWTITKSRSCLDFPGFGFDSQSEGTRVLLFGSLKIYL